MKRSDAFTHFAFIAIAAAVTMAGSANAYTDFSSTPEIPKNVAEMCTFKPGFSTTQKAQEAATAWIMKRAVEIALRDLRNVDKSRLTELEIDENTNFVFRLFRQGEQLTPMAMCFQAMTSDKALRKRIIGDIEVAIDNSSYWYPMAAIKNPHDSARAMTVHSVTSIMRQNTAGELYADDRFDVFGIKKTTSFSQHEGRGINRIMMEFDMMMRQQSPAGAAKPVAAPVAQ